MAQFQDYDRDTHFLAVPLHRPVEVNSRVRRLSIRLDEMVLYLVHPKAIAVVEFDPARLKANVHDDELYRSQAKQFANVR